MYCLWCGWVKFFLPVCFCVSNHKMRTINQISPDKRGVLDVMQGHPLHDKQGCMLVDSQLVSWLSQWQRVLLPVCFCMSNKLKPQNVHKLTKSPEMLCEMLSKVTHCTGPVADLEIKKGGFIYWRAKHTRKVLIATPTSGHAGSMNWIFWSNSRPSQMSGDQ